MANFPSMLAQDEFGVLAQGLVGQVYDVDDVALTTPLDIFTKTGAAFPGNQLTSAANGVLPEFSCPGYTVVRWVSGPFRMDIPCIDQVPVGGTTGQILAKASGQNYDLHWIDVPSLPAGGTDGQVLTKDGSGDFVTKWATPTAGGTSGVSATEVDGVVGDLVGSGAGEAVGALDLRYKKTGKDSLDGVAAGSTIVVRRTGTGGNWPNRPTSRTDVTCVWLGADPDPAIVNSGTGGALNNVDVRWVV